VEDMLLSTKLSSLPRLGGAHYLWVREADEDTPEEAIVGASPGKREESQEPTPTEQAPVEDEHVDDEPAEDAEDVDTSSNFVPPANREGIQAKEAQKDKEKKAIEVAGGKEKAPSPKAKKPEKKKEQPEPEQVMVPTPERQQIKSAVSTETYDVDYGKYRDFSKTITDDKHYPIQYSNVRRKAPRVTTLSTDNSDNRAPDCLRESYNWTAVGRYKGMTDSSTKVARSKQGAFKDPKTYPRFSSNTSEADLKKLFKEQMRLREQSKVQGVPKAERTPQEKKALVDALKADEEHAM